MKHPRTGQNKDLSQIDFNDNIKVTRIPNEALDFVVNGNKLSVSRVMKRQCRQTKKENGFVNDANRHAIGAMNDPDVR